MSDPTIAQQEFLRNAMAMLNMTRDQFAERIGTTRRRIDNWLLPSNSKGFREMDAMAWKFIREILKGKQEEIRLY
jgi:aspartate carbamoyltransferase catalytic subunit